MQNGPLPFKKSQWARCRNSAQSSPWAFKKFFPKGCPSFLENGTGFQVGFQCFDFSPTLNEKFKFEGACSLGRWMRTRRGRESVREREKEKGEEGERPPESDSTKVVNLRSTLFEGVFLYPVPRLFSNFSPRAIKQGVMPTSRGRSFNLQAWMTRWQNLQQNC